MRSRDGADVPRLRKTQRLLKHGGGARNGPLERKLIPMNDHIADVKKFAPKADEAKIAAIVKHLGIALRNRDSSFVASTDPSELKTVRESWCKKHLGLSDDAAIDAGIAAVAKTMHADRDKSRVAFYYLLAERFGKLGAF